MVIAESLLVFSLVKGAVDAVKSALDTAEDVQGIYKGLDALFHHQVTQPNKRLRKRSPSQKVSCTHSLVKRWAMMMTI
jgi:hypothetical protein